MADIRRGPSREYRVLLVIEDLGEVGMLRGGRDE